MKALVRRTARTVGVFLFYALVAIVVAVPVAAEQAIERVHFEDRLGTLPVEVSLSHNGVSTLDTGILGRLYWDRTGYAGFGALLRATDPPDAAGRTLSAYVTPEFVEANAQFVSDPGAVARAYGDELESQLMARFLRLELAAGVAGGLLLTLAARGAWPFARGGGRRRRVLAASGKVLAAIVISTLTAGWLFDRWEGNAHVSDALPMPGVDKLAFSSPQMLEIARQVRPFIEKNSDRIGQRSKAYQEAAEASLRTELSRLAPSLRPREGEVIVVAEADPQGSIVGTRVRARLYSLLREELGEDALVVRTISGDVTSNGTVAEVGFVRDEAAASPDIPTVAVKGDHDTRTTVDQMTDAGIVNPQFDVEEVAGLHFVAANDPAFKTLFGGLVVNESGVTETELGASLREELDDRATATPVIVLVHQPASAAGYVGVDSIADLEGAVGSETTPREDGIADLPPGIINVGHLHDAFPPKVIWNTDGEQVTWTVLNQLGTSGGVEENPTFNRFSTPFSAPLKTLSVQLQYVDRESGLQTGYAAIDVDTDGTALISARADLGLPLR